MVDKQELQVQQKGEVEKGQEAATPTRAFMPNADVFEIEDSGMQLILVAQIAVPAFELPCRLPAALCL